MMEDNSAHFFEGTEKLLEVWFSRQDETKGTGDLRTIPRFVSGRACQVSLLPPSAGRGAGRVPGATAPLRPALVNTETPQSVSFLALFSLFLSDAVRPGRAKSSSVRLAVTPELLYQNASFRAASLQKWPPPP